MLGRKRSEHFSSHKASPGHTTLWVPSNPIVDTQDPKVLAIIAKLEECVLARTGQIGICPRCSAISCNVDVHFHTSLSILTYSSNARDVDSCVLVVNGHTKKGVFLSW